MEWIKCSEKLPETSGLYLVCIQDRYGYRSVHSRVFRRKRVGIRATNPLIWILKGHDFPVTHWAEMPKLPEE